MKTRVLGAAVLLSASASGGDDYPPPVQALVDQGVEIAAEFDTPAGLTG